MTTRPSELLESRIATLIAEHYTVPLDLSTIPVCWLGVKWRVGVRSVGGYTANSVRPVCTAEVVAVGGSGRRLAARLFDNRILGYLYYVPWSLIHLVRSHAIFWPGFSLSVPSWEYPFTSEP
jgi:hypothetical protein